MADGLSRMGIDCRLTDDSMTVVGGKPRGAVLSGYNDHRIVMAFAVVARYAQGDSEIDDAQAVSKSYPDFFRDYAEIGGDVHVIRNGE